MLLVARRNWLGAATCARFNVFSYITFRAVLATHDRARRSSLVVGPAVIRMLTRAARSARRCATTARRRI